MLHGARFLRSAAAALARLAHALLFRALLLMSTSLCCSPTSPSAAVVAPWQHQQARPAAKRVHPAAAALAVVVDQDNKPGAVSRGKEDSSKVTAKKAARGRPPKLVIPPPVACAAGADPFGAAADRETDVATEVEVQGEGFCLASRRGVRHAMEDGYGMVTATDGEGSQLAFYGVYDGHGGRAAVDFVADKLGKNVVAAATSRRPSSVEPSQEEEEDEVVAAIRSAYLTTDSEFLSQDGELYVANVGDCRAVLGSRGGVATALTADHTAAREDERRRIESSGGYVSRGSSGVWRVQDCLAVTRAFGDASMKPWVTAEPDVARRRLTPDCAFLILASDGLWDKVSCQEAVDVAAAGDATLPPCKELVAMARSRGSRDDVTVMVVDLQRFVPREMYAKISIGRSI